jgi:hypothetical protein
MQIEWQLSSASVASVAYLRDRKKILLPKSLNMKYCEITSTTLAALPIVKKSVMLYTYFAKKSKATR